MSQELPKTPAMLIAERAAPLFEQAEAVYAAPNDIDRPASVIYTPFHICDAVYEVMPELGYDPTDILDEETYRTTKIAEIITQSLVKDWRSLSRRRTELANRLNRARRLDQQG